jgi:hypothetical protein
MDFLTARKGTGFDRLDGAVLAVYTGFLAWAIHFYQPFSDEAQAWLIARDSSLHELLLRRLHYEGAPALWPLMLWVACRLRLPYAGINWLGGCFGVAGIYILLRFSPFPRIFRWLLPFTYFLQYQYAVIARPYVMVPVLIFTLCILFTLDRPRPVLFGLVAGLLANVGLHAEIAAGVFSLLYLQQLYRVRRTWPRGVTWRRVAAGGVVFAGLCLCAAAVAFPAADANTAYALTKTAVRPNALLLRLVPEESLPPSAPPLDPILDPDGSIARANGHFPFRLRLIEMLVLAGGAAFYPIATSNLLAFCFLACLWFWLRSRGCVRLMLPYWVSILLSVGIVIFDHHTGIFLLCLVAAVWIALNLETDDRTPRPDSIWVDRTFVLVSLLVIGLQIGWSVHCIRGITLTPSDSGKETEALLASDFAGKRVAGFGFESTSAQPYAPHNLFFNQPYAFWLWSARVFTDFRRTEAVAQHPDAVVVNDVTYGQESLANQWYEFAPPGKHLGTPMIEFWKQQGYHVTHELCGERFRRSGVICTTCEVILEPDSDAKDTPLSARSIH